jgi:Golgi phosphoprotein 3 (GPP34)
MTRSNLSLPEEVLLVARAVESETGRADTVDRGRELAGAGLLELVLAGRITVTPGPLGRVRIVRRAPTGDADLDAMLVELERVGPERRLLDWVAALSFGLEAAYGKRLLDRGLVHAGAVRTGLLGREQSRLVTAMERAGVTYEHVVVAVSEPASADLRTVALGSLLGHTGLLGRLLRRVDADEARGARARLRSWHSEQRAVRGARALPQAYAELVRAGGVDVGGDVNAVVRTCQDVAAVAQAARLE